nr:MAG TPA: hypothetical protein [Caudoviricetes sp.]
MSNSISQIISLAKILSRYHTIKVLNAHVCL